jgi:regulator of protease activity HflC (stomatin/prohibitin superfamily)
MFREIPRKGSPGLLILLVLLALMALCIERIVAAGRAEAALPAVLWAVTLVLAILGLSGLFTVQPNDAKVLTLFGRYVGTIREQGLWWANPFYVKKRISLRIRNFETAKLKVNDNHSNPIEIGAIVVWKVVDTAEALFEVDDYAHFVVMQSEAAVRALAQSYPYDAHSPTEVSLSTNPLDIATALQIAVIEARISHLAYAPEIASAMLRRQQAAAIIAARERIVEGAVGMVDNALALISEKGIVTLDDERKAAMVSNLLVVLCSDRDAQPIVNTGTIYQ